jgi:hypothetical protein
MRNLPGPNNYNLDTYNSLRPHRSSPHPKWSKRQGSFPCLLSRRCDLWGPRRVHIEIIGKASGTWINAIITLWVWACTFHIYKDALGRVKQNSVVVSIFTRLNDDKKMEQRSDVRNWRAHSRLLLATGVMILSPFQYGIDFGMIGGLQAMVPFLKVRCFHVTCDWRSTFIVWNTLTLLPQR